ncbi:MAG: HAD hydrolase-like protein [Promethearchaeota archaeon]
MKNYSVIIFDLDGTLTDPAEGIVNSVRYALKKFHINEMDSKKLLKFIGPPLNKSFEKYYNFSSEKAKQSVDYYREYYADKGIWENQLYPGIKDILLYLSSKNYSLFVGTSKPTVYARQILQYYEIDHFFTDIIGSNLDLTRVSKSEIIEHILNKHELIQVEQILMVGDTHYDIRGAKNCGINSLHVGYGYGNPLEVEKYAPTFSIKEMTELHSFFSTHL